MVTQPYNEYFQAFTDLQTELVNAYTDIVKKTDPTNVAGDVTKLQTKLVVATLENLTESVKTFRKTLA